MKIRLTLSFVLAALAPFPACAPGSSDDSDRAPVPTGGHQHGADSGVTADADASPGGSNAAGDSGVSDALDAAGDAAADSGTTDSGTPPRS